MAANSGPIQNIPRGLLGLLQLKNLGKNPDVLIGNVQPTLDMLGFWLANDARPDTTQYTGTQVTGNSIISGPTVNLSVPQEETWFVHQFSLQIACGAADTVSNAVPIMYLTGTGVIRWQGMTEAALNIAAGGRGGVITARNFWAPPGAGFGWYLGQVTAAVQATLEIQVHRTAMQC